SDDEPRPTARLRRSLVSSSRASGSSYEQNSVPAYIPAPAPVAPPAAAQQDPGVMPVELLVQQPGREHLPQEFNWHSDLTETVRKKFNEKAMDSYTKQMNAWKTVWQKNKRPRFINGTRRLLGTPRTGRAIVAGKVSNDGNPVDPLQLIKVAHTNKKTGQIQDLVIRGVVDLVEAEIASQSQPLSDDRDSTGASTNLSLMQISEMVENAVPKRKGGRLVGLARRASSYPASSSKSPYADPMILEELHDKDERIGALDEQNTTILSENATIRSENATILAELASQKKFNTEIMQKLDRLMSSSS
uniref:Uncharacterized protein n=1 Tax=Brassica oleracea var. oleracea TaxID=109376 RepID=A0A0D3E7K4_BRAOL